MFPIFFQLSTPPPSKVLNIITQLLVENSDEFSVNFVRGFKYVPYISRTTHTHVNAPHTCLTVCASWRKCIRYKKLVRQLTERSNPNSVWWRWWLHHAPGRRGTHTPGRARPGSQMTPDENIYFYTQSVTQCNHSTCTPFSILNNLNICMFLKNNICICRCGCSFDPSDPLSK